MKVIIEISPTTFEALVKSQVILEEKFSRAISSDELIELMLLRLLSKIDAHGKSNGTEEGKYQASGVYENRTKRAGVNTSTKQGILPSIRLEQQN